MSKSLNGILCTELIAREAGVLITNEMGKPLNATLTVEPAVSWVGYGNPTIRAFVEPALGLAMQTRGQANWPS